MTNYKRTAYPTIALFFLGLAGWFTFLYLGYNEKIALWQSILGTSFFAYLNFTPMHDLSHRGVFFKKNNFLLFIESLAGHILGATLFSPFLGFKILHLQHHSSINDPKLDPDYWMFSRWNILVPLKSILRRYF